MRREVRGLQQHLVAATLQRDIVVICHAVIAYNAKSLGQKVAGQVVANEAGRAGDKNRAHLVLSWLAHARPVYAKSQRKVTVQSRSAVWRRNVAVNSRWKPAATCGTVYATAACPILARRTKVEH